MRFFVGSAVTFLAALYVLGHGLSVGGFLSLKGTEGTCPYFDVPEGAEYYTGYATGIRQEFFPLSSTCSWPDGRHVQVVPLWVNLTLWPLLLLAVALFGLSVWSATRGLVAKLRTGTAAP